MARSGTKTSDFGVSKREGHDSSKFYDSKLYEGIIIDEKQKVIERSNQIKVELFNQNLLFNTETLSKIPDNSIHLIVFIIPSLSNSKNINIESFFEKIKRVISYVKLKLIIGGRLIVIVDNRVDSSISKSSFFPFHAYIAPMIINLGLYMRGEIILKGDTTNYPIEKKITLTNCIHLLKPSYSHGLIFSNKHSKRIKKDLKNPNEKTDTISRDQFLEYTKSVWTVNLELISNKISKYDFDMNRVDYYSRFIHLYSFNEDTCMILFDDDFDNIQNLFCSLRKKCLFLKLNEIS